MIDLTPLEVRQKKTDFRRAVRGYDPELVNDFLDLVADRMEELVKENLKLADRVGALEKELEDFQEKEQALTDALMSAQKLREDSRVHAEKESELLIREAKAAAEAARDEAARALAREEETLRQVRARREQLVESFRRLLERELTELEVIEETLELRAPGEAGARPGTPAMPASRGPVQPGDAASASEAAADTPPPGRGGPGEGVQEDEGDEGEEGEDVEDDLQEDWLSTLVEESEGSKEQSRSE